MYTKLIITIDGKEVVFQAHEIIKIAQEVMSSRRNTLTPLRAQVPIVTAPSIYSARFEKFAHTLLQKYESKYSLGTGILQQFLDDMYIAANAPSLVMPLFLRWQQLLNHVKSEKKIDVDFTGFTTKAMKREFLPVPQPIQNVNTIDKWIDLTGELTSPTIQSQIVGWWVLLAGRLIHVNYDPNNRENLERGQHFYVSDHGSLNDVYEQVDRTTASHSLTKGDRNLAVFNFNKLYESLGEIERQHLKEEFIDLVDDFDINDDELMQVLLISFGYPQYLRSQVIESRTFKWPSEIGVRDAAAKSLDNHPVPKAKIGQMYEECSAIFDVTLERIKYQAEVMVTQYYQRLFRGAFSVFKTQVGNIMTEQDAGIYMECELLSHLMQEVNFGNRRVLFRSFGSYGSKDKGDSYHDFERAFASYLSKGTHLSEAELAQIMRQILQGEIPDVQDFSFLPNLVGAWFIAESSRNPLSVLSGLMLLDMIENNVQLDDGNGNNWYTWRNALIHPLKGTANEKNAFDLYGTKIKNIDRFSGSHPMVHGGSVADAQEALKPNTKLTPVRQKEASLFFNWLEQHLARKGVLCRLVKASKDKESLLKLTDTNFDELCEGRNDSPRLQWLNKQIGKLEVTRREKKRKTSGANTRKEEQDIEKFTLERDRLMLKQKALRELIIPGIEMRLSSLDNLLVLGRSVRVGTAAAIIDGSQVPLGHGLVVSDAVLANLVQDTVIDHSICINNTQQALTRGLNRAKAITTAVKKEYTKANRENPIITNLKHIQTISDGNCAINAVALGLLFYKSKGQDLFTSHDEFRKAFAEIFQIDPDTFTQEAFSQLVDGLASPNINLSNPLIQAIITKLTNVGEVREGLEADQLEQRLALLRNAVIQENAYESGNIKVEHREAAIRCLAERGELLQMAMAMALRRFCVAHNGIELTFTHPVDGNVFTGHLQTPPEFGAYVGSDELNFLANVFGLCVKEKQGEFGGWSTYGNDDKIIHIFCTTPGMQDCHYELLLPKDETLLNNSLTMDHELAPFATSFAVNLQRAFLSKEGLGF